MKTKITDYQSLLLEKQRLQMVCAAQEKEMAAAYEKVKPMLNPSYMIKEAILDLIPREVRTSKLVSFLTSASSGSDTKQDMLSELLNMVKTTLMTAALNYLNKFLSKEE